MIGRNTGVHDPRDVGQSDGVGVRLGGVHPLEPPGAELLGET